MAAAAKDQQPEYGTIRLSKELVRKLGIIAQHNDKSIGEIVSGWIGAKVEREYRDTIRSMSAELGGEG